MDMISAIIVPHCSSQCGYTTYAK